LIDIQLLFFSFFFYLSCLHIYSPDVRIIQYPYSHTASERGVQSQLFLSFSSFSLFLFILASYYFRDCLFIMPFSVCLIEERKRERRNEKTYQVMHACISYPLFSSSSSSSSSSFLFFFILMFPKDALFAMFNDTISISISVSIYASS
jgi:hypothetical protein